MSVIKYEAAISQVEPICFDLQGSVKRTIELIEEAAANGASLVAFSELWIPGYPNFLWGGPLQREHSSSPEVHEEQHDCTRAQNA